MTSPLIPDPDGPFQPIADFALEIDGYEAVGIEAGVGLIEQLADVPEEQLPAFGEDRLRIALFFAQRSIKWREDGCFPITDGNGAEIVSPGERLARAIVRALRRLKATDSPE